MKSIFIDRLTLEVAHVGRTGAEELARLVLEGLAAARFEAPVSKDAVSATVTCQAGQGSESLARSIIEDVRQQLERID